MCNLASLAPQALEAVLAATAVRDVWGIGPKLGEQLQAGGIHTVLDLARISPATAKSGWSLVLERTVRELQGVSCIGFEDEPPPRQEITCTRSFGQPIRELPPLIEAVTLFASRAAEKLRSQQGHAGKVLVFTGPAAGEPALA